jgi:hypothetical protein
MFQLYNDENKLHFDELMIIMIMIMIMIMISTLF